MYIIIHQNIKINSTGKKIVKKSQINVYYPLNYTLIFKSCVFLLVCATITAKVRTAICDIIFKFRGHIFYSILVYKIMLSIS